jgi:hypothetical protein
MRPLLPTAALGLCLVLPGPGLAEPLAKPLRAAIAARPGATVVVENLAGRLEVVKAGGTEAVLSGTARCDAGSATSSQALLDSVAVHAREAGGASTLHVTYSVEKGPFRYERDGSARSGRNRSSSNVEYQGRQVKVQEGGDAPLLQADLTLEVPAGVAVHVVNHVGRVVARDVGGALEVKTASADVSAEAIAGAAAVRTGSGDVRVRGAGGLEAQTGSGDADAEEVGGVVSVKTGSGDVRVGRAEAARVSVRTGSGDIDAGGLELTKVEKQSERSLVADVRGGGPLLKISTASGGVRIR